MSVQSVQTLMFHHCCSFNAFGAVDMNDDIQQQLHVQVSLAPSSGLSFFHSHFDVISALWN